MPQDIQKVVYLFGAGATHAEMTNSDESMVAAENVQDAKGLLMRHVSRRVLREAQRDKSFQTSILDVVTTPDGADNIELFITLLENNSTSKDLENAPAKASLLRKLVEEDIGKILTTEVLSKFELHKALFELYEKTSFKNQETILAIFSLNYDVVLDDAYKDVLGKDPDYAFPYPGKDPGKIPLLKLHGSLGWDNVTFLGKPNQKIPIMPLGMNKNYLQLPYNYIWGKAFEALMECNILRIVGCSINPNDVQLVELLFKSHLARQEPFIIDIINRQEAGSTFKSNYNFFPKIRLANEIENDLGIVGLSQGNDGPFKAWLKGIGDKLQKEEVEKTTYLKELI